MSGGEKVDAILALIDKALEPEPETDPPTEIFRKSVAGFRTF